MFLTLFLTALFTLVASNAAAQRPEPLGAAAQKPHLESEEFQVVRDLSSSGAEVQKCEKRLRLVLTKAGSDAQHVVLPRLCATMASVYWLKPGGPELNFSPEPDTWLVSWEGPTESGAVIEMVFDQDPVSFSHQPAIRSNSDGSVLLHARQAFTSGSMLRYEPQSFKNTIGYWVNDQDRAFWQFQLDQPGRYQIAVLQGCGEGQGGSQARVVLRQEGKVLNQCPFEVIETGHFQNFQWVSIGQVEVENAGDYELGVEAIDIAHQALMDVRMVHLIRQAN